MRTKLEFTLALLAFAALGCGRSADLFPDDGLGSGGCALASGCRAEPEPCAGPGCESTEPDLSPDLDEPGRGAPDPTPANPDAAHPSDDPLEPAELEPEATEPAPDPAEPTPAAPPELPPAPHPPPPGADAGIGGDGGDLPDAGPPGRPPRPPRPPRP